MSIVFKIGGTDRTSWLHIGTVSTVKNVAARGVLSCELRSTTNIFSSVSIGQSILLQKDSTTLFAGTIDEIEKSTPAPGVYFVKLHCVDYNQIADRRVVKRVYENWSAGDIVRDIVRSYLTDEGVTLGDIGEGPTVEKAIYSFAPAYEALDELATISGYDWYIDFDKKLNFNEQVHSGTATISSTSAIRNVVVKSDRRSLMNKIYIRGGRVETDEIVEEFESDGATRTFVVTYPIARVVKVEVDRGAGYVEEQHGTATVQKNTIQTDLGWMTQSTSWAAPSSDYSPTAQMFIFENLAGRSDIVVTGIKGIVFTYNAGGGFGDLDEPGWSQLTTLDGFTPPTNQNKVYWENGENYVYIGREIDYPGYREVEFEVRLATTGEETIGWIWNEEGQTIVDGNTTPTAATDKVKVTYHGFTPAVFSFLDSNSKDSRAAIEGGSGLYESSLLDKSIDSKEMAEERGYGLLDRYSNIRERITFETREDGFEIGQLLTVDLDIASGEFLIDRIRITDPLQNEAYYYVEAVK